MQLFIHEGEKVNMQQFDGIERKREAYTETTLLIFTATAMLSSSMYTSIFYGLEENTLKAMYLFMRERKVKMQQFDGIERKRGAYTETIADLHGNCHVSTEFKNACAYRAAQKKNTKSVAVLS